MEAIRSINIRAKAGAIVTVPEDEVWKIISVGAPGSNSRYDCTTHNLSVQGPAAILGGV